MDCDFCDGFYRRFFRWWWLILLKIVADLLRFWYFEEKGRWFTLRRWRFFKNRLKFCTYSYFVVLKRNHETDGQNSLRIKKLDNGGQIFEPCLAIDYFYPPALQLHEVCRPLVHQKLKFNSLASKTHVTITLTLTLLETYKSITEQKKNIFIIIIIAQMWCFMCVTFNLYLVFLLLLLLNNT